MRCASALASRFTNTLWSPVYRSAAVGMQGDDFLNAVVQADTTLNISSTVAALKLIEQQLGRVRNENKFSSRTIDIDLLLYDDIVSNDNPATDDHAVTLPRPEILDTAYVLVPLADMNPQGIHPELGKTYSELLDKLEQRKPTLRAELEKIWIKLD